MREGREAVPCLQGRPASLVGDTWVGGSESAGNWVGGKNT